ncbi:MAG TPA: hypothetical protein VFB30_00605, partial [Spirochaetia bacterium]|nr:hypothetical protein [Spirochaetia bacterium]
AWFLDSYPIFRDLFKPGNDLLARWAESRYSKDFFAEGVELVRSILEEGIEQGIFGAEIDVGECAQLLYYLVHSTLSNDPNLFRRQGQPEIKIDARTLVKVLGRGILAR